MANLDYTGLLLTLVFSEAGSKALEEENARLKRIVAQQALDNELLKEINLKKGKTSCPRNSLSMLASKSLYWELPPPEGASASLIKRLGGIVAAPDDIAGIEEGVLTFYQKFKAGGLSDYSYSGEDIKLYNATNTTKTLAETFDRLC